MSLPKYRGPDGPLLDLKWTRLKSVAEVSAPTPRPPAPVWRPGLQLGAPLEQVVGTIFDRKTVVRMPVEADDGVYVIGGKTVRGRPRTDDIIYEPARAWTTAELVIAERQALAILKAHDFPAEHTWPEPRAWAWSEDQLWWADTPAHAGAFVFDDGREEDDDGMSGAVRGGLGWPDTGMPQDARAAELWPRFSAFGWALEIQDAQEFRRSAVVQFKRMLYESVSTVAADAVADADADTAAVAASDDTATRLSESEPFQAFIDEFLTHSWRIGFSLGAYLAEQRLRTMHSDSLGRGEKSLAATKDGAKAGNKTQSEEREIKVKHAVALAKVCVEKGLPSDQKSWTFGFLAEEVSFGWKLESKKPRVSTIVTFLKAAKAAGEACLAGVSSRNASVP